MDLSNLLFIALPALFLFGLAASVIFLIGKTFGVVAGFATRNHPASTRIKTSSARTGYVLTTLWLAFVAYRAIYPSDSFYLGEFETAAGRKPPKSTKVLFKAANYPDLHGDYCSFSRMEVSRTDYDRLLGELELDSRFTGGNSNIASTGKMHAGKLPSAKILRYFVRNDVASDHYYEISFLESVTQFEVSVCVT